VGVIRAKMGSFLRTIGHAQIRQQRRYFMFAPAKAFFVAFSNFCSEKLQFCKRCNFLAMFDRQTSKHQIFCPAWDWKFICHLLQRDSMKDKRWKIHIAKMKSDIIMTSGMVICIGK
jgi:hypothetical protein